MIKAYFHVLSISLVALFSLIQLTKGVQIPLYSPSTTPNPNSPEFQNQILPRPTFGNESGFIITKEFSEYVEGLRSQWGIPGLTLGVVRSGGVVEVGAWGERTEDGELMTTDVSFLSLFLFLPSIILLENPSILSMSFVMCFQTLFNIASCSKAFAASAIGILMDDFARGKNVTSLPPNVHQFDWEMKVVDLLPGDWLLMDEWTTRKANIRDVMSHVSGLPR